MQLKRVESTQRSEGELTGTSACLQTYLPTLDAVPALSPAPTYLPPALVK